MTPPTNLDPAQRRQAIRDEMERQRLYRLRATLDDHTDRCDHPVTTPDADNPCRAVCTLCGGGVYRAVPAAVLRPGGDLGPDLGDALCAHGMSASLCEGPGHYTPDTPDTHLAPAATPSEAHAEWHRNAGVPIGTPGCPQDACHDDDDQDQGDAFGSLPAADPGELREGRPPVAVLIPADASPVRLIRLPTTLPEMQAAVGGWLELVDAGPVDDPARVVMWCDEEGKLKGRSPNVRATLAARYLIGAGGMDPSDILAGDVLITGADADGETTGVPAHALLALRTDRGIRAWRDDRDTPPRRIPPWAPGEATIPESR